MDVFSAGKARDLGVWLDSKLTMSTHIDKTYGATFFYLYNIQYIRKFLSKEITETLIHTFITSRLHYCNSLFYGLPNSLISKLQRIQNVYACLLYSVPKFCHVMPILRDLHWLPVRQRMDFKIILIIFKILNNMAPSYLSSLICVTTPSCYSLHSSCDGTFLCFPLVKSSKTLGDCAFMFAAPKLWNSLPCNIRMTMNLLTFKMKLKTFLFSQVFHD